MRRGAGERRGRVARVRGLAVVLVGAAALAAAASGGAVASDHSNRAASGTFVLGFDGPVDTLNPMLTQSVAGWITRQAIYPFLVQYDANLNIVPYFGRSWSTSKDGLTWTFRTQPNALWSDGQPLTAADAAWTIETALRLGAAGTGQLAEVLITPIRAVKATSPNTLVISFRRKSATVLEELQSLPILPKHVWAQYSNGAHAKPVHVPVNAPVVSGGPFMLTGYTPNQSETLTKNPHFFGKPAAVDTLGFSFFSNDDAMALALKSGTINAVQSIAPIALPSLRNDSSLSVITAPALSEDDLVFNINPKRKTHHELLDPRLRQALSYAIDRPQFVKTIWAGQARVGESVVPFADGSWYDPSVKPQAFDVATANALLDKLGFKRGAGGIRVADGHPMSYTILISEGSPAGATRFFQLLQSEFSKVGVKLTAKSLDLNALSAAWAKDHWTDYDATLVAQAYGPDPDTVLQAYTCAQSGALHSGDNIASYCSPAFDKLYTAQHEEINVAKRRALVWQAQRFLAKNSGTLVITYEPVAEARSKKWSGFVMSPAGSFNYFSTLTFIGLRATP
jgi:peptide/nickel transport system substrate-binding protein